MSVMACPVSPDALLAAYVDKDGAYTDCFETTIATKADLPAFITAFYTTWLFRLERAVLNIALRKRITDSDVAALADATAERFAAWTVEGRGDGQILLCDISGVTRSYLAVAGNEGGTTRLIFGSAVVSRRGGEMPFLIRLTTPLHRLYSIALLGLAARKLRRG